MWDMPHIHGIMAGYIGIAMPYGGTAPAAACAAAAAASTELSTAPLPAALW